MSICDTCKKARKCKDKPVLIYCVDYEKKEK